MYEKRRKFLSIQPLKTFRHKIVDFKALSSLTPFLVRLFEADFSDLRLAHNSRVKFDKCSTNFKLLYLNLAVRICSFSLWVCQIEVLKRRQALNSQAPVAPCMAQGPVLRRSSLSLASYLKTTKNDSP